MNRIVLCVVALILSGGLASHAQNVTWDDPHPRRYSTWSDPEEACLTLWSWACPYEPTWLDYHRDSNDQIYRVACGNPRCNRGWVFAQMRCLNGAVPTNDAEYCGFNDRPPPPDQCTASDFSNDPGTTPQPIHTASGTKLEQFTDFSTSDGRMTFRRTYTNRPYHLSSLGWGWRHNYERSLSVMRGQHMVQLGDSTILAFNREEYNGTVSFNLIGLENNQYSSNPSSRLKGNVHELAEVDGEAHRYELTYPDGTVELLDDVFQLVKRREPGGYTITIDYTDSDIHFVTDSFGRSIELHYEPNRRWLEKVVQPDGQTLEFDFIRVRGSAFDLSLSVWSRVAYALETVYLPDETPSDLDDNPTIRYHYDDPTVSHMLSGITDERGVRIKTIAYGPTGRALSSEGPNGRLRYSVEGAGEPDAFNVTNPLGHVMTSRFERPKGMWRLAETSAPAGTNVPAMSFARTYDANADAYLAQNDYRSAQTNWVRNSDGLPTQTTLQASGVQPIQIQTSWDSDYPLPTQIVRPGLTVDYTYDAAGNVLSETRTDTLTFSPSRTTTFAYGAGGILTSVDGPLAGPGDETSISYTPDGYVSQITRPGGQVTTITSHDGMGRPLGINLPGGATASLTYSTRGWLAGVDLSDGAVTRSTRMDHDAAGNVTQITLPTGASLAFTYDETGWVTAIASSAGETVTFTHDDMGNITSRMVSDGEIQFSSASVFNTLGQLIQSINATGDMTQYSYSAGGDLVSMTYPDGHTWNTAFDGLGRVLSVTDPQSDTESLSHTTAGTIYSFEDGRNLKTTYTHNGFGEVLTETSPDRGTTTYTYDEAGRVIERTDAEDTVQFTYDAAGRLVSRTYPGQPRLNIDIAYDGAGRVERINDAHGHTRYIYNAFGEVTVEVRKLGAHVYRTRYVYEDTGQLRRIDYPSGRKVLFVSDGFGRATAIRTQGVGATAYDTVVRNVRHKPFGPIEFFAHGNDLPNLREHDQNYRIQRLRVGSGALSEQVLHKFYGYDAASRVSFIADRMDESRREVYRYSSDGRLVRAIGPWGDLRWAYDGVGNRLAERSFDEAGERLYAHNYEYPETSNRLDRVKAAGGPVIRELTHSGDGNITSDVRGETGETFDYIYDAAGRLSEVRGAGGALAQYGYDAFNRRVTRSLSGGASVHYVFELSGKPIAEHDASTGAVLREYIWLGDLMVGWADASGLYYVHGGHLGQPLAMTDGAGEVVWRSDFSPFGSALPSLAAKENDLRFPGQWAQAETGLIQNWHRDYDPSLGRYLQADPWGLAAGQSLYGYVGGDPVNFVDPLGLERDKNTELLVNDVQNLPGSLIGPQSPVVPMIDDLGARVNGGSTEPRSLRDFILSLQGMSSSRMLRGQASTALGDTVVENAELDPEVREFLGMCVETLSFLYTSYRRYDSTRTMLDPGHRVPGLPGRMPTQYYSSHGNGAPRDYRHPDQR